ncbi:MAG: DUF6599 family protein [FCB group bacterium]
MSNILVKAQTSTDIPLLSSEEFPGWNLISTKSFEGQSLFGYIDGGADLYLEYGFEALTVQEVSISNDTYKVEIWKMSNKEAAFGIFSILRFKCFDKAYNMDYLCQTQFQVMFVNGNYFVNIINTNGSESAQRTSIDIANRIMSKGKYENVVFPYILNESIFQTEIKDLKYITGPLGLQNGYPDLSKYFQDAYGFKMYVLHNSQDNITLAIIEFSMTTSADKFLENLKFEKKASLKFQDNTSDGIYRAIWRKYSLQITFLEANEKSSKLEPYVSLINDYLKMGR